MRKLPLHSRVTMDGITQWLIYAPLDIAEAFEQRVQQLIRDGHTRVGAERMAYKEWTAGKL